MRTVILLCTIILGHCINPQIIPVYCRDMDVITVVVILMTSLLAMILDFIDLQKKLNE